MMQQESKTFKMTAAGRRYLTFLAAFNSGNPNSMLSYIHQHFDPFSFSDEDADAFVQWYQDVYTETGGMNIHKTFLSQDYYVIIIVEAKKDGRQYLDKMSVTREHPFLVTEYFHEAKP